MQTTSKPEILIISPILPIISQGGSNIRLCNFIKYLSNDFNVHVLAVIDKGSRGLQKDLMQGYAKSLHIMEWEPCSFIERILNFISGLFIDLPFNFKQKFCNGFSKYVKENYHPKIVIVQKSIMAGLLKRSGLMDHFKKVPLFLDEGSLHYIAYLRDFQSEKNWGRKILSYFRYIRLFWFSKKIVQLFKYNIVVTAWEYNVLKKFYSKERILTACNGIDIPKENTGVVNDSLIILGPYDYEPNLHALDWFLEHVLEKLRKEGYQGKVYVVGRNPGPQAIAWAKKDKDVVVIGFVRDLGEIYGKVGIFVCPMWKGGGVRTKILEAMGYGKVVVATSIGAEGIEAENNKDFFIHNEAQGFCDAIMQVSRNPKLVEEVGKNAMKCIQEKYQWERVLKDLIAKIGELATISH